MVRHYYLTKSWPLLLDPSCSICPSSTLELTFVFFLLSSYPSLIPCCFFSYRVTLFMPQAPAATHPGSQSVHWLCVSCALNWAELLRYPHPPTPIWPHLTPPRLLASLLGLSDWGSGIVHSPTVSAEAGSHSLPAEGYGAAGQTKLSAAK